MCALGLLATQASDQGDLPSCLFEFTPNMPMTHRMRRCLKVGMRMNTPDRMAPQMMEYSLQL